MKKKSKKDKFSIDTNNLKKSAMCEGEKVAWIRLSGNNTSLLAVQR